MRQTNFNIGRMNAGFETCYNSNFKKTDNDSSERYILDNNTKNTLERSHWDHSRSWNKNFMSETSTNFKHQ